MKRFIFLSIVLALPFLSIAQDDSKYLKGAVTLKDGAVVFDREISIPQLTGDQIYGTIVNWATEEFSGENQQVMMKDDAKRSITVRGQRIAQIRLGLFPSKIKVHFYAKVDCFNGKCALEFVRLHYTNNPGADNINEVIRAENYITDKAALNKAGTKLTGGTGSYRKATIDVIDEVTKSAEKAIFYYNSASIINNSQNNAQSQEELIRQQVAAQLAAQQLAAQQAAAQQAAAQQAAQQAAAQQAAQQALAQQAAEQAAAQAAAQQQAVAQPQAPITTTITNTTTPEGFIKIEATKIPGNIIKAVSDNGIHLTAVNGTPLEKSIVGDGGLGSHNGEAALFFIFKNEKANLKSGETIMVRLVNEVYKNAVVTIEPWLIAEAVVSSSEGNMLVAKIISVFVK